MDVETIILGIITLILSALALVTSILVFLDNKNKTKILKDQNEDNRKKTGIMEKQLKLLQEQSESQQDVRNALKIVGEIQERIPKLGKEKYDWGDFGRIAPQRFLEMLHDSGEPSILWQVAPLFLFGHSIGSGKIKGDVNNFEAFEKLFTEIAPKPGTEFAIGFISIPKIMLNSDVEISKIQVKDYLLEIYTLAVLYEKLNSVEKIVNMYDSSVLPDIQKLYTKALRALFEIFGFSKDIEINSKIKTKEMPSYLLGFISLDVWQECIKELKENIRPRLIEITRHLRESM